jgi:NHS family xanthosine MFS transporter
VLYLGMALAAAMCVYSFWLPHTPPGTAHAGPGLPRGGAYRAAVQKLFRNGNYVVLLASFFLISGSFSILIFFSPVRLVELGLDRAWVGPVQCVGVLLEIVLFRWRTLFVHRLSYATTLLIGCAALVARQLLFAFSGNLWVLTASYLLAGMVIVFFHIGVSVLVNTIAAREVRSTAQTLLVLFGSGMGPMFSNAVASWLTHRYNQSLVPVFLFSASLAGVACLLILVRGAKLDRGSHAAGS